MVGVIQVKTVDYPGFVIKHKYLTIANFQDNHMNIRNFQGKIIKCRDYQVKKVEISDKNSSGTFKK